MPSTEAFADMDLLGCACQQARCPICRPAEPQPGESTAARVVRRLARLEHSVREMFDAEPADPTDPAEADHGRELRVRLLPAYYALVLDLALASGRLDAERGPRPVLRCSCGRAYTGRQWRDLDGRGAMSDGLALYELRNCADCGSTRMVRTVHPALPAACAGK